MAKKGKAERAATAAPGIEFDLPKTIEQAGLTIDAARNAGIEVRDDGTIVSGHHRAMMLGKLTAGAIGTPGNAMLLTDSLRFGQDHPGLAMNVRSTNRGERIEELAKSIMADGILQPLLVWRDVEGDGFDYVVDGSRRLTAVREIRKAQPDSFETLPALLIEGGTAQDAKGKSLAANVTQLPLHQVDQFEAFAALVAKLPAGSDPIAAVVSRFGVTPIIAERRLALGTMVPEIRAAWRAGDMDPAVAFEYANERNPERQSKLFKKLGKNANDWTIRRAIFGEDNHDVPALLKFVTPQKYEAEGGGVLRDLFSRDNVTGVSDLPLLQKLAREKLDAKVAELTGPQDDGTTPWSWASVAADLPREWEWNWTTLGGGKKPPANVREKSGAVVEMQRDGAGFKLTYGVVKPGAAKVREAKGGEKKKASAKPEERGLSANMVHQLQIRASQGVAAALELQPDLCLTALAASFAADVSPLHVSVNGYRTVEKRTWSEFAESFKAIMKGGNAAVMKGVADIAARAVDFRNDGDRPLEDDDAKALVGAINPKALNKAMREVFAGFAQEYFDGIPVPMLRAAIGESGLVSKDTLEGDVAKWGRRQGVGYAMADNGEGPQILATGWLPPELRGPGYDGPKAKAKAKPAKGAKKKKAKR